MDNMLTIGKPPKSGLRCSCDGGICGSDRGYCETMIEIINKLAAYEGTARSPDWCAEKAKAEDEGRILPQGYSCEGSPDGSVIVRHPGKGNHVSDGYHTFNELYHHRAILFSVVCSVFRDRAWKSRQHHDGTMFDDMFIVGIDTPDGQATYHYDVDPYWGRFAVQELERAPEWDGHTPDDAIARIASLGALKEREVQP